MRRTLAVARREYLERVRSKGFIIATLVAPLIMSAFMVVPMVMSRSQQGGAVRVSVVDGTGLLRQATEAALESRKGEGQPGFEVVPPPEGSFSEVVEELRQRVAASKLDAYVVLPADVLESSRVEYRARNVGDFPRLMGVRSAVEEVVVGRRLTDAGLDADHVRDLTRGLDFVTVRITESGAKEDHGATLLLAVVLVLLIYTSVLMWGTMVMNGVVEEKTSRIVELVASAVSPARLLAGKVLGIGGAGLTQFLVWTLCLVGIAAYGKTALSMVGKSIPEIGPLILVSFVVFYVLGFFLYGLVFAAIGAAVNSSQEAQSLSIPAMMPLIGSMMFMVVVLQRPDSALSVVLSLIPFFTPLVMFLRIVALTPPLWQIILSIVLMLAAIAGMTWITGRIYRVGILMYGKRPTFPELVRWAGRR